MLKIYFLISIITSISFAQKMTLDVRDYFTKKPIILDSINIKNTILGIDTTVANPKIIDFTELFIINSVQSKRYFDISLNNNQLTVNSNERIENIKMFDLLGREVINANVNNTNYQTNINSENNSLFYFISIRTDKGLYNSKLINSTYENLQIANVMPISSNWKITLYKFGYYTETIEDTVIPPLYNTFLKKIPLIVNCSIYCKNMYHSSSNSETSEGGEMGLDFVLNLFSAEEYSNGYNASPQCYYIGGSGYDFVGDVKINGGYFTYGLPNWTNKDSTQSIFFDDSNVVGYDIYATCIELDIKNFIFDDLYSNKLDTLIFDYAKGEFSISYRDRKESTWSSGTYKSESTYIGTNTEVSGTIKVSIKK